MRCGWLLASTLGAIVLGGCATPTTSESLQPVLADASEIPKVSVAADRCLESFRFRSSMQGTFFRELIC